MVYMQIFQVYDVELIEKKKKKKIMHFSRFYDKNIYSIYFMVARFTQSQK